MNIVDASGWLEYLAAGPVAGFFSKALSDPALLLMPTLVLHEIFSAVARQRGETAALEVLACMKLGHIVPLDADIAVEAAHLGHRRGLSFADSVILATTLRRHATLWTCNPVFKDLPGARFVAEP